MKKFRHILWAAVAIVAGLAAWLSLDASREDGGMRLGADFSLVTHRGDPITDEDLLGSPHLIFFGFTHCPEICPTTLFEASSWVQELGEKAGPLKVYFVSVDPERDTQEMLSTYLSSFDERITGITGPLDEIDRLAKGFHVYYRKVDTDDGSYTIDHTASIYLMRADGSFAGTIAWGENPETALRKIERLLEG